MNNARPALTLYAALNYPVLLLVMLLHLRVALSLLEDRVLATVGDVPTEFVNNAATGAVADSGPFMQLRVNGETLAPVLDVIEEYVFESGMLAENWVALLGPALDAARTIGAMSVDGRLDADALVFDSRVQMRPAAPSEEPAE